MKFLEDVCLNSHSLHREKNSDLTNTNKQTKNTIYRVNIRSNHFKIHGTFSITAIHKSSSGVEFLSSFINYTPPLQTTISFIARVRESACKNL